MMHKWVSPIWAECMKELSLYRRYPLQFISIIVIMYLVFLQLFYVSQTFGETSSLLNDLSGSDDYMAFAFIGIIFWNIGLRSIADVSQSLNRDIMAGLIENILLSPLKSWFLLLGRGLSSLLTCLLFLSVLAIPIIFIFSIELNWDPLPLLLVLLLTFTGIQGFSIALAGVQFIVKNIGSAVQLLNFLFLYLCGIIFPLSLLPEFVQLIAKALPITLGLESAREIMLSNVTLMEFVSSQLFWFLLIQSLLYYVIGIAIYNIMFSIARKKGTLGQY